MTPSEAQYKDVMWNKLNAEYLQTMKEREEKLAKEREEGKPEKKKRRTGKRKAIGPSNTAGEAIEKMLQEKKISNKINYDILKTLTEPKVEDEQDERPLVKTEPETSFLRRTKPNLASGRRKPLAAVVSTSREVEKKPPVAVEEEKPTEEEELDEDYDNEPVVEPDEQHASLRNMLEAGADDDYYGYDDY